jgi:predicted Zn-dependent peptidase
MNLAYYELIGKAEDINQEEEKLLAVSKGQIARIARQVLVPTNASAVLYKSNGDVGVTVEEMEEEA